MNPWLDKVVETIGAGRRIRRRLPDGGRLHVEPDRPFLCLYRGRSEGPEAPLARAVRGQASWVAAFGAVADSDRLEEVIAAVARALSERYGACLLLEVVEAERSEDEPEALAPCFEVDGTAPLDALRAVLADLHLGEAAAEVREGRGRTPLPGHPWITLAVAPIYRSRTTGRVYPALATTIVDGVHRALLAAAQAFTRARTELAPVVPAAVGRGWVDRATRTVDGRLEAVGRSFDLLLEVTPLNTEAAWEAFSAGRFERAPRFLYRPSPVDPQLAKRALFAIPLERVEDPVLAALFREKLEELDRRITMVQDRGTTRFLLESLQLYGGVEDDLLRLARRVLTEVVQEQRGEVEVVSPEDVAARGREEIAAYGFDAPVRLRSDVGAGLMVSGGELLVSTSARVSARRVDPLLQHEVGTHLVTWFNGRAQRLHLLAGGLAGYEGLQEGIAVLAEYLVGGLTRSRLRLLAARVLAVHALVEGASFVETWRLLREHGQGERAAFVTAMRVHRAGGLTKDAIYLRGLARALALLEKGVAVETLWCGKIASKHVGAVADLAARGLAGRLTWRPRFLDRPEARARLDHLRGGVSVVDLALHRA